MEVTVEYLKRCVLVKISGRVDSGSSPQLQKAFEAIYTEGHFRIVVDLMDIDYMSSAGIRVLIKAQETCKRYNRGEVVLTEVPQRVYEAIELAGFLPLFKFYDTVLGAVAHF